MSTILLDLVVSTGLGIHIGFGSMVSFGHASTVGKFRIVFKWLRLVRSSQQGQRVDQVCKIDFFVRSAAGTRVGSCINTDAHISGFERVASFARMKMVGPVGNW